MHSRVQFVLLMVVIAATVLVTTVAATNGPQDNLSVVRQATARFHDIEVAKAAGYELGYVNGNNTRIIAGCVANVANPAAGVMGYHYFKKSLIDDNVIDVDRPEGLVYISTGDGGLRLVAVEYVVPGPNSNPRGVDQAPTVLGIQMHILVPAVGFYIQHFWVWGNNPAGMYVDWNPSLSCP